MSSDSLWNCKLEMFSATFRIQVQMSSDSIWNCELEIVGAKSRWVFV